MTAWQGRRGLLSRKTLVMNGMIHRVLEIAL